MKGATELLVTIVVVVSLLTQTEASELRDLLAKNTKECLPEFNLSKEELAKLKAEDFKNPTKNMQCLDKCAVERSNLLKNGVVDEKLITEMLLKSYPKEFVTKFFTTCPHEIGKDDCESVFNLSRCYGKMFSNH